MAPALPALDDTRLFRACFSTFTPLLVGMAFVARAWALPTPPPDLAAAARYADVAFEAIPRHQLPEPVALERAVEETRTRPERPAPRPAPEPRLARGNPRAAGPDRAFLAPIGTLGAGFEADRRAEDLALRRALAGVAPQVASLHDPSALRGQTRPVELAGPAWSGPDAAPEAAGPIDGGPLDVPTTRAPLAPAGESAAADELDDLSAVVRAHRGRIEACAARALAQDPDLQGRVSVAWDVSAGRVGNVTILESTADNAALDTCIRRAVASMRFAPGSTGRVDRYTWVLSGR